jgi:hypothetical protein
VGSLRANLSAALGLVDPSCPRKRATRTWTPGTSTRSAAVARTTRRSTSGSGRRAADSRLDSRSKGRRPRCHC